MGLSTAGVDRLIGAALGLVGIYLFAVSLFQLASPGAFFDQIGPFGTRNDHYTRDTATFGLALAVLALVAVRVRSWRMPALVVLVVQFTLHAANHLADIDEADPYWIGPADFAGLAVASIGLASLLTLLWRDSRESSR